MTPLRGLMGAIAMLGSVADYDYQNRPPAKHRPSGKKLDKPEYPQQGNKLAKRLKRGKQLWRH